MTTDFSIGNPDTIAQAEEFFDAPFTFRDDRAREAFRRGYEAEKTRDGRVAYALAARWARRCEAIPRKDAKAFKNHCDRCFLFAAMETVRGMIPDELDRRAREILAECWIHGDCIAVVEEWTHTPLGGVVEGE